MSLPPVCTQDTPRVTRTAHAMLVPWGLFARRIGLVQELEQVPLPQRTRTHTPHTKLIEFLVAILGGCAYLQDISRGPHPLDQDRTVAEAWGQPGWFAFYNRRQTIEAGVKEGKHVFQMHPLKVRSAAGLAIQEEFAVLAANLVRWASHWLQQQCPEAKAPFNQPRASVKQLVRVAANTTAWVIWQPEGDLLLMFDELSPFPGVQLRIGSGGAFQLPLPLFKSDYFGPF